MVGHLAAAAIHTRLGAKDGVAFTPSYFVDLNTIPRLSHHHQPSSSHHLQSLSNRQASRMLPPAVFNTLFCPFVPTAPPFWCHHQHCQPSQCRHQSLAPSQAVPTPVSAHPSRLSPVRRNPTAPSPAASTATPTLAFFTLAPAIKPMPVVCTWPFRINVSHRFRAAGGFEIVTVLYY